MMVAWLVLLLAACGGDEAGTCDDLCTELVQTCAFDAYPTLDSCLQGCAYDGTLGADLEKESTCIAEASCDPFKVVTCQHRFGPDPTAAGE